MTDLLKRNLAPLTDKAWAAIDAQAARILKGSLSARKVVDVSGPHGWAAAAVNLGALEAPGKEAVPGVAWALRKALPLVEIRAPFAVDMAAMDEVDRGRANPDFTAVDAAARRAALFEETAVYHGLAGAGIEGILAAAAHRPVAAALDAPAFLAAVEKAVVLIEKHGIGGPYALVLGTAPYQRLMSGNPAGYPLPAQVKEMVHGDVYWSPAIDGGLVLSRRGGDYELTLGQDLSLGYAGHEGGRVQLFVTASFTFRVLEPAAAVGLNFKG